MKSLILFVVLVASTSSFAITKVCDGGERSENILGPKIEIELTKESLEVISTSPGYEDGEVTYPEAGIDKKTQLLKYAGPSAEEIDGYIFLVDPDLMKSGTTKTMNVTLDQTSEGTIDADYTCHDKR